MIAAATTHPKKLRRLVGCIALFGREIVSAAEVAGSAKVVFQAGCAF
jgi:hypothetical protein